MDNRFILINYLLNVLKLAKIMLQYPMTMTTNWFIIIIINIVMNIIFRKQILCCHKYIKMNLFKNDY